MQSTYDYRNKIHIAIIMDCNGRWAHQRGLPRTMGHRAGVKAVRQIIERSAALGVCKLTLFAFSADNWRRPQQEVGALLTMLQSYLRTERQNLVEQGIRLTVIGRRDRLPERLVRTIEHVEQETASGRHLHLCIALDYSSREAIARAASRLTNLDSLTQESFCQLMLGDQNEAAMNVDLLIRTGGEKRLSDFLLWESAYAELLFAEKMWPDFGPDDLQEALVEFHRRDRRFGGLSKVA